MRSSIAAVLLAAVGATTAQTTNVSEPTLPEIEAAAATTLPYSPTSNVKGRAFDRFYQIWLENVVSSELGPHRMAWSFISGSPR
jgi:acid phosphatase